MRWSRPPFRASDGRVTVANLALVQFTQPLERVEAQPPVDGVSSLPEIERRTIEVALQQAKGNVSKAARALGISRDTMRYRMAKHSLTGE